MRAGPPEPSLLVYTKHGCSGRLRSNSRPLAQHVRWLEFFLFFLRICHARIPLKNHKNIGFLSNTGPDPLKITKLPSQHSMLGHHQHASETDVSPLIVVVVFGSFLLPSSINKNFRVGYPLGNLSGSAHVCDKYQKLMGLSIMEYHCHSAK